MNLFPLVYLYQLNVVLKFHYKGINYILYNIKKLFGTSIALRLNLLVQLNKVRGAFVLSEPDVIF